ncbi:ribbon-helix-helix protein, CopG family [Pseudogulbenkiania subflava]|uniref:Ribbon-helix-helix protein, copG family n=1 Tax=Pseudogulbenkiania subflava DSM 22618 TaxID=1123014 RepID=A0A1Y6C8K9_9NEIS|nr:ribbon-helix-helix protein, CopG family [Pseudogulbenkiania subflava]SMF23546.1 Ribbon-helix-helix protein, copG family [Pseudogulbenkiania subflava DSM 22618]SMF32942.1 Ribbon-helix-helix protein, copG family [Pseudogulbenkiania subflava DSM 22618]SMF47910.1 Ribbon-helix-helix protein, copG family [Pseudogulbenkiania subflava DSM 22618]
METKTARLTVLIDPVKKKAFEELCAAQDLTPSQVVRQLIRNYLEQHQVEYATKSRYNANKLIESK